MPITSMVVGIFTAVAAVFNESGWDRDAITGFLFMICLVMALGIEQLRSKRPFGRKMAISGIVLGVVAAGAMIMQLIVQLAPK